MQGLRSGKAFQMSCRWDRNVQEFQEVISGWMIVEDKRETKRPAAFYAFRAVTSHWPCIVFIPKRVHDRRIGCGETRQVPRSSGQNDSAIKYHRHFLLALHLLVHAVSCKGREINVERVLF